VRRRRHNPTWSRHLRELCAPAPVPDTGALGLDPTPRRPFAFAVLANETLFGRPGNVPRATGASGPRVLGRSPCDPGRARRHL
jgi:anhydro-N-acetylmuramic acid kinase